MRTPCRVELCAAVWMLMVAGAAAQPPTRGPDVRRLAERYVDSRNGLSLADAIAQAVEHEPMLRAARADADATRGMRVQAGLRPNPTVSVERRQEPAGTDNQTMAQVEWPLDLFRRATRTAVADQELAAAERTVDDRLRLLIGDVRMRYGDAAAVVRELTIVDDLATSARREVELLRRRVEEGAVRPLERDRMEVELRRFESDRLLATGRADAALFELKRTIGLAPHTSLKLKETLETLAPGPIPDQDVPFSRIPELSVSATPAIGDRPDVREAETRVRLADARIARARNDGRFDVSLFGSYMRMDQSFPQMGFDEGGGLTRIHGVFHYLSAGAMVTVPLANRNQGEVARAQAERVGAAARLEAVQLAAQTELAAAEAQDLQARRAVASVAGGARLARQNLDVVQQTYELGRATVTEVLAEQRRYLDVERAYTETLKAAYQARTALQRARGER